MRHIKNISENFEELGIEKDTLTIDFLNRLLANHFVLFLKIYNFHWNVVGKQFASAHQYTNDLYDQLFEDVDDIAERIRQLNGKPVGTLKGYLEITEIEEYDDGRTTPDAKEIFEIILRDYEFLIRELRNFLSTDGIDNGTVNFLEDMIMKKEKNAWLIRARTK
jgi:starvation-inducible DNA-binding protein